MNKKGCKRSHWEYVPEWEAQAGGKTVRVAGKTIKDARAAFRRVTGVGARWMRRVKGCQPNKNGQMPANCDQHPA